MDISNLYNLVVPLIKIMFEQNAIYKCKWASKNKIF